MGEPQEYNRKEFLHRIGTFFLLLGVGAMVFFLFSESANQPELNYFCNGMVLLILGFAFRSQLKKPVVKSGRFQGSRDMFNRYFRRSKGRDDDE